MLHKALHYDAAACHAIRCTKCRQLCSMILHNRLVQLSGHSAVGVPKPSSGLTGTPRCEPYALIYPGSGPHTQLSCRCPSS